MYYKTQYPNEPISYGITDFVNTSDYVQVIDADEYNAAISAIEAENLVQQRAIDQEEQSKDEQIAALEEENAALLYKLLTGDDLD